MSSPTTPEGWDDIDPDVMEAAKAMRGIYVALIAAGFTMIEASTIIGAMFATGNAVTPPNPNT